MAKDTIYLCNFRVSVDGEWLCLRELTDVQFDVPPPPTPAMLRQLHEKDPMAIERLNLLNVMKLVVKELIESSLKYGRMLDSDHVPLHHFFILLEHAMRHGLKPKRGLLGPKKELWNVLECVEKYMPEAADITASVRDLPTVKTHLGRARAWLRLALMQKRLADYFRRMIDRKEDILGEFYERDALMMCDEAIVIGGLLVGLNVIDCNLCVKEEDLDCEQGVIDFSLYLREPNSEASENEGVETNSFTAVLDQKNYIEELNRHLNATVTNLQQKVEHLQTTNALMKEDLAITKNQVIALQEENTQLHKICDRMTQESKRKLEEAKADMSTERETYQTTQVGLDSMYNDIKQEMQDEIQKRKDCETSLKSKSDLATQMETKAAELTDTIHRLEDKNYDLVKLKAINEELTRKHALQIAERDQMRASLESDLKIEREWRASLQESIEDYKKRISTLKNTVEKLMKTDDDYEKLKARHLELQNTCAEHEQTLEELGLQLKDSKLKMEDMKENQMTLSEAVWTSDSQVIHCKQCNKTFSVARRRHHCRNCGDIFCNQCSDNTMPLPSSAKPVRVCDRCYTVLLQRYSATSGVP